MHEMPEGNGAGPTEGEEPGLEVMSDAQIAAAAAQFAHDSVNLTIGELQGFVGEMLIKNRALTDRLETIAAANLRLQRELALERAAHGRPAAAPTGVVLDEEEWR